MAEASALSLSCPLSPCADPPPGTALTTTTLLCWQIVWIQAFPSLLYQLLLLPVWLDDGRCKHSQSTTIADETEGNCPIASHPSMELWQFGLAWRALGLDNRHRATPIPIPTFEQHDNLLPRPEGIATRISSESNIQNDPAQHVMRWGNSLGYGEVTETAIYHIVQRSIHSRMNQRAKEITGQNGLLPPPRMTRDKDNFVVVDLGSGTGRALLAATLSLQQDQHSRIRAVGIEIVPSLHQHAAMFAQSCWQRINEIGTPPTSLTASSMEFHCADFTTCTDWVDEADWVLIHATVFEVALWTRVEHLCHSCRPGTIFALVSRPLTGMKLLETMELEMDWGRGTIYLQQKD